MSLVPAGDQMTPMGAIIVHGEAARVTDEDFRRIAKGTIVVGIPQRASIGAASAAMGFFRRLFAIVAKTPKAASSKDKPRRRLVKAVPVNNMTDMALAVSSKKEDAGEENSRAAPEGSPTRGTTVQEGSVSAKGHNTEEALPRAELTQELSTATKQTMVSGSILDAD
ncbi:hypothetical protein CSHISOI_07533 [Colletotrichum shisoi]|uniref:Uncharacterized protein n=1 Tax=Colletotrichum shisoi TaxID=2078593 RepID=A0A5Q4BGA5_9PEZI|nr:hypothetical protein CSHISOI_07533 [Colletotrichum shisoi]